MNKKTPSTEYHIRAKVWVYSAATTPSSNAKAMKGAWHFLTITKKHSRDIEQKFGAMARGWRSLRVRATIGATSWQTSIFPDKKLGAYLLPLKADVRKKEKITDGDTVDLGLEILV